MLAGVSFSDLRRIAIDKMINAGGWVINDYERQVNGARVFVVIAQTPSDGRSPERLSGPDPEATRAAGVVLASPAGFEPATGRLEGGCSVH